MSADEEKALSLISLYGNRYFSIVITDISALYSDGSARCGMYMPTVRPAHSEPKIRKTFVCPRHPHYLTGLSAPIRILWPIPWLRYRPSCRYHHGRRRDARRRRLELLRRHLRRPRLINHHPLPRPIPFQVRQLVAVLAPFALVRMHDRPRPGAVGGPWHVALAAAAAAAEDGERVDLAVVFEAVGPAAALVVRGDADVVGHEADGEGVEEWF